jgi:hypothetical protein
MREAMSAVGLLIDCLCLAARAADKIPFPSEYRKWATIKSVFDRSAQPSLCYRGWDPPHVCEQQSSGRL